VESRNDALLRRKASLGNGNNWASLSGGRESVMKYLAAWLVGVPTGLIVVWFLLNQTGC